MISSAGLPEVPASPVATLGTEPGGSPGAPVLAGAVHQIHPAGDHPEHRAGRQLGQQHAPATAGGHPEHRARRRPETPQQVLASPVATLGTEPGGSPGPRYWRAPCTRSTLLVTTQNIEPVGSWASSMLRPPPVATLGTELGG
ncbi:TPA: hypothetical protein I8510_005082, partial [Aeromonas hydrophila]|nr:hypothetical protein [Aeromonas hydrophila]HAT3534445.1 hypothetical protein [Aeromonas hydrophila]